MPADAYAAVARHAASLPHRPVLLGIAGPVGVGKSTTAAIVRDRLAAIGLRAEVVATDGFLLPTAELEQRGLLMRKGFPESYDADLLDDALGRLAAGEEGVAVPAYSHDTYDRVPGAGRVVAAADVVIVEGVNVLQPPAVDRLHVALYVDADEADLRRWFTDRFLELCAAVADDETSTSFYRMFVSMDEEQRRDVAVATWDHINGVNLRDHIGPSRGRATHVLRKRGDHSVESLDTVR